MEKSRKHNFRKIIREEKYGLKKQKVGRKDKERALRSKQKRKRQILGEC